MTTPATPSSPQPAGDDRNLVAVDENYVAASFEDKLQIFWKKNGTGVLALCGLVLLGIVGKGGWDKLQERKELGIEQEYAAATTPEQKKAFIAAHAGHSLTGVAQMGLADDAYGAGKAADALAGYEQVLTVIKTGPLAARAQLGRAMAKIQLGKASEGTSDLRLLAGDSTQLTGIRMEAAYQLASLAAENGDATEARKYFDQVIQFNPSNDWSPRLSALSMRLPVLPAPIAPVMPAPAGTAPKASDAPPAIQLKVPGK